MRALLAYTSARILIFVAVLVLLYLAGARGLLLVALAVLVSGIISLVVLARQRDAMSGVLSARLGSLRGRVRDFGGRIDEGTQSEDHD
jgi:hypothetical protein